MKSMFKLFGIIALAAVIGFTAACSNGGGGGGPGSQTTSGPTSATYVSYDADGNKYELVITNSATGRAAYNPKNGDRYTLTITLVNGTKQTSTGTVTIKPVGETIEITLNHSSGETVTVTVASRGEDINIIVSFDDKKIPVDNGEDISPPRALPYILNSNGTGYILINGKDIVKANGEADILEKLPDGKPVTAIGPMAFAYNTALKSVTIPASVTDFLALEGPAGGWAGTFEGCTNLTTVNFAPNSRLKAIGNGTFYGTGIKNIEIPASVTYIGHQAFRVCESLTAITIPAGVTSLGFSIDVWSGVFQSCKKLETVTFAPGSQLKIIGAGTFEECNSLKSVTIPAGVTHIGAMAFTDCTSITSIIIPASVTSFGIVRDDYIGIDDGNDGWGAQFEGWTSSQTINVQGYASEEAAAAAWGWNWLAACDAVRKYWNGSSYQ